VPERQRSVRTGAAGLSGAAQGGVGEGGSQINDGEEKANAVSSLAVSLRTCTVSCCDLKGVEHAIEVTADSLYEAVAQGLRAFRENDWVEDIGRGQTTITVVVRQPAVEHKVRVREFEQWLESQGRTPAEMSLKSRLRDLMKRPGGKV
jgi:hypothetical protein